MVGLLPAYGRSPDNKVFAMGGMTSDWTSRTQLAWSNINSDTMRPAKTQEAGETIPNLPHVDGRYAKFGDHIDDFVAGFEDYAKFLLSQSRDAKQGGLFDGFAGLAVRKIIRPTRFYYMLLQRLRNHRSMDDGVTWSAQADFLARLADWERASDPLWPLQRAERAALLALNVPHFVSPSDGNEIRDASGISVPTEATPGLDRARARVSNFDAPEIAWQVEVIRQNTALVSRSEGAAPVAAKGSRVLRTGAAIAPGKETFLAEADKIAADLARYAIRKGPAAAWIGLDWLGDSEVAQLVPLGADLYNGVSGIALFLAAHAAMTGSKSSRELALAAVAHLRKNLKGRNAARMARSLGIGGATGLGSIVYAFAVMAKCLRDDDLLADAHVAAKLFSDDLIAADKQLDVIGGSAGGILGLLRLYRDSPSADVLASAAKCGDHLLAQPRRGENGGSWLGQGSGEQALNGMSHGAAGFAYALASLAAATGRDEFANAASQCIAFENASYDAQRNNWPDFRGDEGAPWPCQWCHGAPGIGIARAASVKRSRLDSDAADIGRAQRARRCGARLARPRRHAVLRHARQHRILLRGRRRAWPERSARTCIAAHGGCHGGRGSERRLSLECRQAAVQSRTVPRARGRRLHVVAAGRWLASQRPDLGIADFRPAPAFMVTAGLRQKKFRARRLSAGRARIRGPAVICRRAGARCCGLPRGDCRGSVRLSESCGTARHSPA